ncbi:MAG: hypothetical protein AB8H86_13305 [Polyangiales bacterium]
MPPLRYARLRERALTQPTPEWRPGDLHLHALFIGHGYLMNGGFFHLFEMEDASYEAFVAALDYFDVQEVKECLDGASDAFDADTPLRKFDQLYFRFADRGLDAAVIRSSALSQGDFAPF